MDNTLYVVIAVVCVALAVYYAFSDFMEEATKPENESEAPAGLILHFKGGVKAHRLEIYRDITIVYLSKPVQNGEDVFIYHFFWKGEIQFGENTDIEALRTEAVNLINNLYNE